MCDIITKLTNPRLTVFADGTKTKTKMKNPLYSKRSYSIIVVTPPQVTINYVQYILTNFEKYVGVINSHTSLHTNSGGDATYIEFKHWYNTPFTQKLHSELVIAHELGESLHIDNTITMNIDGYAYNLMLWKLTK
jgi:hypothetical protein